MSKEVVKVKWKNCVHKILVSLSEDTVMDLKRKIYSLTKLLPKNQKFFFNSKVNNQNAMMDEDGRLLSQFNFNWEVSLAGTNEEGEEEYSVNRVARTKKIILLPPDAKCETPQNVQKLERFVKEFDKAKIMMPGGHRKGKKLIIIDGDYVLYNNEPKMDPEYKELLNGFLSMLYLKYDIVLWTASSLPHLKSKMKYLSIPDSTYEFAALLDLSAMLSIKYSSSKFLECMPLRLIWDLFPKCDEGGTIMLESREQSLAMNLKNGILTEPLNQLKRVERQDLLDYLLEVAEDKNSECHDHRIWRSYWTRWKGWEFYEKNAFHMPPFVFVIEKRDEEEALCHMYDGRDYIIKRTDDEFHPFLHYLRHSRDKHLLRVYHLSNDDKNKKDFFISEHHKSFVEWMAKNRPTINAKNQPIGKVKLDHNRFIVPFRSLVNSTVSAIIETRADFEFNAKNVLVVDVDGSTKLVIGPVKLKEPHGALKCLQSLVEIVKKWFEDHKCEIPSVLQQLIMLLETWDFTKFGVDRNNSLRMITKHPVFYQANPKPFFDLVGTFDSEIRNDKHNWKDHVQNLVSAFNDLDCKDVDKDTIWYDKQFAHPVLKQCMDGGTSDCRISVLIRDVRNIAAHLNDYTGTPPPKGKSQLPPVKTTHPAKVWSEVYESMEVMNKGLFSSIHLCCIKMGQAYRFVDKM